MVEAIHRIAMAVGVNRRYVFVAALFLTSCATASTHQFAQPTADWQTRSGQLMYRNAKATVIGDVVLWYSKTDAFELTFSKGPGLTLLTLRQDAKFAEVKGPMAGRGWFGTIDHAPGQLRGWLELREKLIRAKDRPVVKHSTGAETFILRF